MSFRDRLKLLIRKSDVVTPTPDKNVKFKIWGNGTVSDKIVIPKLIWLYWHDDVVNSPITNICIKQIEQLHPEYKICIVHWSTLFDYLPDFPMLVSDKLPLANLSDLVRLMLLNKYGGIYLDASVFLTESINWVVKLCEDHGAELTSYYTNINTTKSEFPTIESWCLVSIPHSNFINAWLQEYKSVILSSDPETYYEQQQELSVEESIMGYTYYKVYFSAQLIVRRSQNYRIVVVEADSDAFIYSIKTSKPWSDILTAQILLINKAPNTYPKMIKLISSARNTVDKWITKKYYKKDSLIGKLLENN